MPTRATAINEHDIKVLTRVLQDGDGSVIVAEDPEEPTVRFGRTHLPTSEGDRVRSAIRKLVAAEYLEYTGDGTYELTELGEEYLAALGVG